MAVTAVQEVKKPAAEKEEKAEEKDEEAIAGLGALFGWNSSSVTISFSNANIHFIRKIIS